MKIAMIMLAAGNSRRFGANKLLYEIDGMPMYRHVLNQLIQVKNRLERYTDGVRCDREKKQTVANTDSLTDITRGIVVVTQYDAIAETVKEQGIQVLRNPHPERGISSSLRIGLNANLDADAVLFTVSDQPWLTGETIYELILAFLNSGKEMACISSQGKLGNPCIFRKKYYEELLALERDKGGKKVLMKHLEDTCIYETKSAREIEDIDYLKQTEINKI